MNKILKLGALLVGAAAAVSAFGQGISVSNYYPSGPQGPYTILTQPMGLGGGLFYYPQTYINLSLGANASGIPTNQVMAGTTNVFGLTNTTFMCGDYSNPSFQFVAQVSNRCNSPYLVTLPFVFSNDGTNFDTVVDPVTVSVNTQLTNGAGLLIFRTNFLNTGAKAVALLNIGLATPGTGTNTYLTNCQAFFSGQVDRKHVNVSGE